MMIPYLALAVPMTWQECLQALPWAVTISVATTVAGWLTNRWLEGKAPFAGKEPTPTVHRTPVRRTVGGRRVGGSAISSEPASNWSRATSRTLAFSAMLSFGLALGWFLGFGQDPQIDPFWTLVFGFPPLFLGFGLLGFTVIRNWWRRKVATY